MAGGDSRIQFNSAGGMGMLNELRTLDANSKASGNMTNPVEVDGKTVYMTDAGKDLYEKYKQDPASTPHVEKDPGFLSRFFLGEFKEDPASIGKP